MSARGSVGDIAMYSWVKTFLFATAACSLLAVTAADRAHACACCSEPGQRFEATTPLRPGLLEEILTLRAKPTASLYSDAGFPDSIKGVADPQSRPYKVAATISRDGVAISTISDVEQTGSIFLPMPDLVSRLEIDPRVAGERSPGGGPLLYKEWRLDGTAALAGIFSKSGSHATARFILHGQGNGCPTAGDFSHWTLEVRGPGIRFTLLGAFER
jgi:hypothetical protein